MTNGYGRTCNGCSGGNADCYEDIIFWTEVEYIGTTKCNYFTSWSVTGSELRVTIDSGGNAQSRNRDSYQTSCMICQCDGTAASGICPENPDRSEGIIHYYREMDNGGMTYAEAQTKCVGQLSMARFYTQAEYNLIEQLVGM